jgi:hypothetical protein
MELDLDGDLVDMDEKDFLIDQFFKHVTQYNIADILHLLINDFGFKFASVDKMSTKIKYKNKVLKTPSMSLQFRDIKYILQTLYDDDMRINLQKIVLKRL